MRAAVESHGETGRGLRSRRLAHARRHSVGPRLGASSKPTDKLVILTHGYLGHAKQMGLFGQHYYNDLDYNIFMPDARGHGKSEGDYYGFGWQDRLDLIDWTNKLSAKTWSENGSGLPWLIDGSGNCSHGERRGRASRQVKAIIADSPYQSVYQLFTYQMNRMFHLPAFPLLDSTSALTKVRAGYSFREASALKQVKKASVPIFYIHGMNDTFVPTEMAGELERNTSSESDIFLVPKANHGEAFALAGETYKVKMDHFLDRYMK